MLTHEEIAKRRAEIEAEVAALVADAEAQAEKVRVEAEAIRQAIDDHKAADDAAREATDARREKHAADLAAAKDEFLATDGKSDRVPALLAADRKAFDDEHQARMKRLDDLQSKTGPRNPDRPETSADEVAADRKPTLVAKLKAKTKK